MRRLRAAVAELIGLVSREHRDRAFDAELESHLQLHIDDNLRAGMSRKPPADVRSSSSAALSRLGRPIASAAPCRCSNTSARTCASRCAS